MLYIAKIASPPSSRLFIEHMIYIYVQIYLSITLWNHDIFINVNVPLEDVSCVLDAAQLLSSAKRRDYAQVERYIYN